MYRKVLVPLDGSERAEAILPHVVNLAQRYQAEVLLFNVVELPQTRFSDPVDAQLLYQEFDRRVQVAQAYLDNLRRQFNEQGIRARVIVTDGPVVDAIVNTAREKEIDLIALASHGRTGLARFFYGSVALGVLHRADRPLLLIRSQDEPPDNEP
jgi:nucleotide-binding universal stress UspA family protein